MSDKLIAYEQTTWQDGRETPINADALNKMENGIGAVTTYVINNTLKKDEGVKFDGGTAENLKTLGLLP